MCFLHHDEPCPPAPRSRVVQRLAGVLLRGRQVGGGRPWCSSGMPAMEMATSEGQKGTPEAPCEGGENRRSCLDALRWSS